MEQLSNALAGQLFDVFSAKEQNMIATALGKLKDTPNEGTDMSYAYTNGFLPGDMVYPFFKKFVLERLEKLLGRKLQLTTGMYLKEQHPWKVHTDYIKGDHNPDLAILVPLNTEPLATHTVVFNEQCKTNFDDFILNNSKLVNNARHLAKDLMSHELTERLEYISLLESYAWTPGSVIYWDRRLIHSSDNFPAAGIAEKHALVMFTNHD